MITSLKSYLLKKADAYITSVVNRIVSARTTYLFDIQQHLLKLIADADKELMIKDREETQLHVYYMLRDMRELRAEISLLQEKLDHVTKHIGQQATDKVG